MPALHWIRNQLRDIWLGCTQTNAAFSSTKFFSSVAYVTVTWVVVHQELLGRLSTETVLVFLGTVAGHNVLLRSIAAKKEQPEEQK